MDAWSLVMRYATPYTLIASIGLFAAIPLVLLSYIVYALYLHSLAKYPGPLLGRLTQCYDVYHAYKGDKHVLFHRLHQQYGPIVRFSPNTVSINHPAALKAIYAHGANVQKSTFYKCFRAAPQAVSTLLATDKAQHARKRRVMSQAFSAEAMRGMEVYVVGLVQDLVDKIDGVIKASDAEEGGWSGTGPMASYLNWLVFDIMGDLVFGKSFGTLGDKPENREGIRLLGRAAKRNYVVGAMPILAQRGLEKWLPFLRSRYLDRCKCLAFGKAQVLARTKENGFGESSRRDIFSYLLHAKDPETGTGFPMPELWMEGNTLIVAGSDTSSTTMSAVFFYLLHNPKVLRRLETEVRSAFDKSADIRMGLQMQCCSWLRACIDESMRMSPAVAGLLPREVMGGGFSIAAMDLHFPAGVEIGVPIYAIQHNAEYVDDPFSFEPDRWLQQDDVLPEHRQNKEALNSVFCPFSVGQRSCLGKPLVYMELSIAIARLVWEYDMRLAPEQHPRESTVREIGQGLRHPAEYQYQDCFLSNNEGVFVEFRVREK
ncbi:hypothetical protein LTR91_005959 [Friedmanniomyces endolithicus]|uniref:Uncharacterized protein n=1 Tax=Friedmanniomyces endolithicus TaxID=329885 RepID=A0AAN6KSY7_9PEZI|nr:hypothetical protein LTR94_006724 [Friedmanniomyces endolithicus]KAK0808713.1 hypothetical protein LTR59_002866 [Friedmanniomyces endolithicus]KAK0813054.1 hypothetical protein LTR38_003129 [Friedmanniomyces endolithicus]KAK0819998.1 hypothetical protein LTR75_001768 [Friedmanniomyces endolithicus]KAK0844089.1 hypothetical protein LTR03_008272 [Friedmanniomyces endolithicus]